MIKEKRQNSIRPLSSYRSGSTKASQPPKRRAPEHNSPSRSKRVRRDPTPEIEDDEEFYSDEAKDEYDEEEEEYDVIEEPRRRYRKVIIKPVLTFLMNCIDFKNKFIWNRYKWLAGIVEDSGVTSTEQTPSFFALLGQINTLQTDHRGPHITAKQLKVFFTLANNTNIL
jgi:hypothetical protein